MEGWEARNHLCTTTKYHPPHPFIHFISFFLGVSQALEANMILAEHGVTKAGANGEHGLVHLRVLEVDLPEIQGTFSLRFRYTNYIYSYI